MVELQVDFSTAARALYATDASYYRQTPIGVVFPNSIEDVVETVKTCHEFQDGHIASAAGAS